MLEGAPPPLQMVVMQGLVPWLSLPVAPFSPEGVWLACHYQGVEQLANYVEAFCDFRLGQTRHTVALYDGDAHVVYVLDNVPALLLPLFLCMHGCSCGMARATKCRPQMLDGTKEGDGVTCKTMMMLLGYLLDGHDHKGSVRALLADYATRTFGVGGAAFMEMMRTVTCTAKAGPAVGLPVGCITVVHSHERWHHCGCKSRRARKHGSVAPPPAGGGGVELFPLEVAQACFAHAQTALGVSVGPFIHLWKGQGGGLPSRPGATVRVALMDVGSKLGYVGREVPVVLLPLFRALNGCLHPMSGLGVCTVYSDGGHSISCGQVADILADVCGKDGDRGSGLYAAVVSYCCAKGGMSREQAVRALASVRTTLTEGWEYMMHIPVESEKIFYAFYG